MEHLPDDIMEYIFSYISCKNRKGGLCTSKTMRKHISCKIVYFKSKFNRRDMQLLCCKTHEYNLNKIEAINTLNQYKECTKLSTMHFENKEVANIAYPYVKCFGTISHKCCDGMGIMFI